MTHPPCSTALCGVLHPFSCSMTPHVLVVIFILSLHSCGEHAATVCAARPCANMPGSSGGCSATANLLSYQCTCLPGWQWDGAAAKCAQVCFESKCLLRQCMRLQRYHHTCSLRANRLKGLAVEQGSSVFVIITTPDACVLGFLQV